MNKYTATNVPRDLTVTVPEQCVGLLAALWQ